MSDNNETRDDIITDEVDASREDDLDADLTETAAEASERPDVSPDDTADYLDALKEGHASGEWNFTPSRETSAFYDVTRYHNQERRRRRRSVLRVVALVFVALVVAASVGVGMFVANINARLSENVTEELREQLAQPKEPDEPFYMLLLGVDKDQGRVDDVDNYGADESAYRSDSIMLCRIDPKNVKVTMVSIHRDTLVDLVNLASIAFGYSIGGFDADKFVGDTLTLGIGREGEPYEGIGRGPLNIAGLPVYRDAIGGVGTPTSDHERTKLTLATTHLVVLINGYDGNREHVVANAEFIQELLRKYCQSDGGSIIIYP